MTDLKKLDDELKVIFESYKKDWLNFYDGNNSYISKSNNNSFYKEKNKYYRDEISTKIMEYSEIQKTMRETIASEYFILFKQYEPKDL